VCTFEAGLSAAEMLSSADVAMWENKASAKSPYDQERPLGRSAPVRNPVRVTKGRSASVSVELRTARQSNSVSESNVSRLIICTLASETDTVPKDFWLIAYF
jgi:hypothetical protein